MPERAKLKDMCHKTGGLRNMNQCFCCERRTLNTFLQGSIFTGVKSKQE